MDQSYIGKVQSYCGYTQNFALSCRHAGTTIQAAHQIPTVVIQNRSGYCILEGQLTTNGLLVYFDPFKEDCPPPPYGIGVVLSHLQADRTNMARIQRWALPLSAYSYQMVFRAGKDQGYTDGQIRLSLAGAPEEVPTSEGTILMLLDFLDWNSVLQLYPSDIGQTKTLCSRWSGEWCFMDGEHRQMNSSSLMTAGMPLITEERLNGY